MGAVGFLEEEVKDLGMKIEAGGGSEEEVETACQRLLQAFQKKKG